MFCSDVWHGCRVRARQLFTASICTGEDKVRDTVCDGTINEPLGLGFFCAWRAVDRNAEDGVNALMRCRRKDIFGGGGFPSQERDPRVKRRESFRLGGGSVAG